MSVPLYVYIANVYGKWEERIKEGGNSFLGNSQ